MPRHPEHKGGAYTTPLIIKVNPEMLSALDKHCKAMGTSRSAFMRELFREWMREHGVQEQKPRMVINPS